MIRIYWIGFPIPPPFEQFPRQIIRKNRLQTSLAPYPRFFRTKTVRNCSKSRASLPAIPVSNNFRVKLFENIGVTQGAGRIAGCGGPGRLERTGRTGNFRRGCDSFPGKTGGKMLRRVGAVAGWAGRRRRSR